MSDTSTARPRLDVAMPERIARLPRDHRGFPVPWFVQWRDGKPLFPVMDAGKWAKAVHDKRCWVCGDFLGRWMNFVVGPMCTINRISAEPPSHEACALYAVKTCPFMLNPRMGRVPHSKIGEVLAPGGIMEPRNPGTMVTWACREYHVLRTDTGPILRMGDPVGGAKWWTQGRECSAAEAGEAFDAGCAKLREHALNLDGAEALPEVAQLIKRARSLLPG